MIKELNRILYNMQSNSISHADASNLQEVEQIVEVISESIRSCILDHHNDQNIINQWLANKTVENLVAWITANYSLVYKHNNDVVGFFMASLPKQENHYSEILLNYVLPKYQGQGIGKQLLLTAKNELVKQGINGLIAESTITAKDFYQHNEFAIQKEIYEESVLENRQKDKILVAYQMVCHIE